jgi:hydroxymethylpyrimidine kinase/phosphomethylpyrimidine kinase
VTRRKPSEALRPAVCAVGGSDPSAGAGIQADVRTLEALGVQPTTVVTALTVQTGTVVTRVEPVRAALVAAQLRALLEALPIAAVKTGMLATADNARAVARVLRPHAGLPLVVDPVLRASGGERLARAGLLRALIAELFPLAACVTANLDEAAAIVGWRVADVEAMKEAARAIVDAGAGAAIVKGGHLRGAPDDVVFDGRAVHVVGGQRVRGRTMHGSGCAFASALAAHLAVGRGLLASARAAKRHVAELLDGARPSEAGGWLRQPPRRLR